MNAPKVTVILTVYEAADYLQRAIDSVLEQTFPDFEVRLYDDGSKDPHVAEILFAVEDPRVHVQRCFPTVDERKMHCRYALNINRAAAEARGEFLTFLCGDDYFMPDRLERMVALAEEGPHDVVYGGQLMVTENGIAAGERAADITLKDAFHKVDLNSVMVTRKAFEEVEGFPTDPDHWKDADAHFWRRLTFAGYSFEPVVGGPTDAKHYRRDSVDGRMSNGRYPW